MITLVLTYRNRNLKNVENCLNSLAIQSVNTFKVDLIDYGSVSPYQEELKQLINKYDFVNLVYCNTQQQLWCKSRAINISLKQCDTSCFFVGDIDMIYHPDFIKKINELQNNNTITYFQVGFLSELESKNEKLFKDYEINFKSKKGATGMTLYPTSVLKTINGYDEFYHGWGSEDTDTHIRLKNAGYKIEFYDKSILILHQWHSKFYRSQNDLTPFHSTLEQINQAYLEKTKHIKKTIANLNFDYGTITSSDYKILEKVDYSINITNKEIDVKSIIANVLLNEKNKVININITKDNQYKLIKQVMKKWLGRKTISFLKMQNVNDMIIECIIFYLRNQTYKLKYDIKRETINFTIKL